MFSAKADAESKRLTIVSDQALSPDDFRKLIEATAREAAGLAPGWVAAVDFRGMWITDPFINEQFQLLQSTLLAKGAAKIGTLLDSDPVKMRLWQSGTASGSNRLTQRFYDVEAWEEFLSGP
jgi:hypothetical protein